MNAQSIFVKRLMRNPRSVPAQFTWQNTVWVAKNGNDSTGKRNKPSLPFLTPSAAKAAAQSEDTIFVLPGAYTDKNLLKFGVNWRGYNATINWTTDAEHSGIFDDSATGANAEIYCRIEGFNINFTGYDGVPFKITNTSNITIKDCIIKNTGEQLPTTDLSTIWVNNASAILRMENCIVYTATSVTPTAYCTSLHWQSGDTLQLVNCGFKSDTSDVVYLSSNGLILENTTLEAKLIEGFKPLNHDVDVDISTLCVFRNGAYGNDGGAITELVGGNDILSANIKVMIPT